MKVFVLIIAIFLQTQICFAQATIADVSQRLERVEKGWDLLEKGFIQKETELKNTFDAEKNKMERTFDEIREQRSWGERAATFLGGFVIGIVTMFFSFWTYMKNKIKINLDDLFQKEQKKKEDLLKGIIDQRDTEGQLKTNKKIVVLSPDGENVEPLKKAFNVWMFKNVVYKYDNDELQLNEADIIIFNDLSQNSQIENAYVLIGNKKTEDCPMWFYLGKNKTVDWSKFTNGANSIAQLYGNLLNTLYYCEAC